MKMNTIEMISEIAAILRVGAHQLQVGIWICTQPAFYVWKQPYHTMRTLCCLTFSFQPQVYIRQLPSFYDHEFQHLPTKPVEQIAHSICNTKMLNEYLHA